MEIALAVRPASGYSLMMIDDDDDDMIKMIYMLVHLPQCSENRIQNGSVFIITVVCSIMLLPAIMSK